ncbi:hypothetical protein Zm00014a_029813 [Zea mays]|uniref:Uncharacterized protein n=1 Tax=Zea mays TaxID=4577 RepID=A0A3L6EP28_MAIZE|nr:hypothetical protein Zm00014a_029813 [Zea mays]
MDAVGPPVSYLPLPSSSGCCPFLFLVAESSSMDAGRAALPDYPHARPRYNSNNHETPSCRALDVFDGISQHVPTRSAALVARTSNSATVDVVPRASPMR